VSGICGIVNFDGAPIDPELLKKMAEAMRYRGPDGINVWHDGAIGLAHCHFWTTPEDVGERQPISSPDGRCWIAADARVDNRAELMTQLRSNGAYPLDTTPTDAQLILAAYARWGEECAHHLIGDLAFAVWDSAQQKLFAARDVMGIRQLYYTVADGTLYFATAIGAVLAGLPQRLPLNRPLIEAFVKGSVQQWVSQTVYEGLYRLPPAHTLMAKDGEIGQPRLYYVFGSQSPPGCRSDQEWIDAFRSLLDEAIRCRMRSTGPVGFAVSGGLDSSALACAAYELRQRQPSLPEMRLYSTVFEETPESDETEYFDAVADFCAGAPSTRIPGDGLWALREFGTDGGYPLDEPELYLLRSHTLALVRPLVADGGRVVIWGEGGDQISGTGMYLYRSALRGVGWRNLRTELPYYQAKSQSSALSLLLRAYLWPWPRSRFQQLLIALRTRDWRLSSCGYEKSLEPAFIDPPRLKPSAQIIHHCVRAPFSLARYSMLDLTMAFARAEWRLPFLDQRLVGFMLHAPHHLIAWRGVRRVILRESMHGTLPEKVRTRADKCHFEQLIRRGLGQERGRAEALLTNSRAAAPGFLDTKTVQRIIQEYLDSQNTSAGQISKALCLEGWLRAIEDVDP
jgi:asparagine synthase (glutamine-hydrolysing)